MRDLCKELLNIELDKENQISDWGKDKLSDEQLMYAAKDVLYLHQLKNKLDQLLIREARYSLASDSFKALETRVRLDIEGFQDLDIFAH